MMADLFPQIAFAVQTSDPLPMAACMGNDQTTIWLHAIADLTLLTAYFLLPLSTIAILFHFKQLSHKWITGMICLFMIGDAGTYLLHFLGIWQANYWNAGVVKMITAATSLLIAMFIGPLILYQTIYSSEQRRRKDDDIMPAPSPPASPTQPAAKT